MKIAHLILAHKNPQQLALLVNALRHPGFTVFIHLDKKSNQAEFSAQQGLEGVTFIRNRASIYWAGYGTIQATLNGFEEILPLGFDYINVLSAQDFPIRRPDEFYRLLEENRGTEYITCESVDGEWKEARPRVNRYHFINFRIRGKFRLEKMFNAVMPRRKPPMGYTLVGRANWFALTAGAAQYIFDFQRANPSYVRFFWYCWGADEFFFSSILYNSQFRNKIRNNLTYVDWSVIENPGHPKILDSSDLPRLKASDKFFARKFDITRDAAVITSLREWLDN